MALAVPVAAQEAPVPAPIRTVQQDFEAATQLGSDRKDAEALAIWETLEKRTSGNKRSQSIVRVRKAVTLARLGRLDEASQSARAGLTALPANDPTLREDRTSAYLVLAQIDKTALDYGSALANYRAAREIATTPSDELAAMLGEIRVGTFVDPDAMLPLAARAEAMLQGKTLSADVKGIVGTALSELYLNLGRYNDALKTAGTAVRNLGGLTVRTSMPDVAARSTYAIAALRLGREEDARLYMAYTGAGRAEKGSFRPAAQLRPPECGGDAGLSPDDVAVIEFTVGDDGAVADSVPVYASRKGSIALAFARVARGWSWTPSQMEGLPTFFRTRVRVEMRCSTAFPRPDAADYRRDALAAWLGTRGVTLPDRAQGGDAARLPVLRAELASAEAAGPDTLAILPTLYALIENALTSREESKGWARRALALGEKGAAPPLARLALETKVVTFDAIEGEASREFSRRMAAMRERAPYAGDAEARNAITLMIADAEGGDAVRRTTLTTIASDAALPAAHPLKVGALMRLATLEQAAGDARAAQAAFEKSGLTASQCALLDKQPAMLSAGGTFPSEALRWAFEGWTSVQYDIDAAGKAANPRAVISYPPFVFTKAGTATLIGSRFEKSFRPDGGLGCGGRIQSVQFVIPTN